VAAKGIVNYGIAAHFWIPKAFEDGIELYTNKPPAPKEPFYPYSDWALLDLQPRVLGFGSSHSGTIGDFAGYMRLPSPSDFAVGDVDNDAEVAGYPVQLSPTASGSATSSSVVGGQFMYVGDDHSVVSQPNFLLPYSSLFLFSDIDMSLGDSGAGVWHEVDDDVRPHVYAVLDGSWWFYAPYGLAAGLSDYFAFLDSTRVGIIVDLMMDEDMDETNAVLPL